MVLHDLSGRILDANEAYARLLGYDRDELIGRSAADVIHPADLTQRNDEAAEGFSGQGDGAGVNRRLIRRDGSVVQTRVCKTVLDRESDTVVLGVIDPLGERDALEHSATHDDLTDLLNRRGLRSQLATHYPSTDMLVAMIDVDDLKGVNDTFGHAVGDSVLSAVAAGLSRGAPAGAVIGRWSGDEFVVCVPADSFADAARFAARLAAPLEATRARMGENVLVPSVSVGVATLRSGSESLDRALHRADVAMYQAKNGRPSHC